MIKEDEDKRGCNEDDGGDWHGRDRYTLVFLLPIIAIVYRGFTSVYCR